MFGPTGEGAPNGDRRLELAEMAINGGSSTLRSVLTLNSLSEVEAASSPFEYCSVADNAQFYVFFRLEFESDVSVGCE